jgi:hypothetical protein
MSMTHPRASAVIAMAQYRYFASPGQACSSQGLTLRAQSTSGSLARACSVCLDLDADWGVLPSAQDLFPSTADDPFAYYLSRVREWQSSTAFRSFLNDFYVLE